MEEDDMHPWICPVSAASIQTHELQLAGLDVSAEYPLPVVYKDVKFECGYRLDLWVE